MNADQNRVVVKDELCSLCLMPIKHVHHRHFPEIQVECCSTAACIAQLAELLGRHRDSASSLWHRGMIEEAIADVTAFIESSDQASTASQPSCRCHPPGDIASGRELAANQNIA
ncbi:hypothetical protein [Singulisphaera sp. PoT]|uniref:hypothetical protein n=1 Tax=Singulisphaera sp. PoT TaxID=3411797 RepID=UPI003BF567B3